MWLTPGRASGRKNSGPILFVNTPGEGECYEKEVLPHRKTDYKPMIYILKNRFTHVFMYSPNTYIEHLQMEYMDGSI